MTETERERVTKGMREFVSSFDISQSEIMEYSPVCEFKEVGGRGRKRVTIRESKTE